MLYMARTAHLQADDSISCTEVAEADAETRPWAILALITNAPGTDPTWRLVGTYATETAALAARRRLSRRMSSLTTAPPAWVEPSRVGSRNGARTEPGARSG
jgi:hypothetical protein